MINFFRNIRKNLLAQGKTAYYLKYAIGEIVATVTTDFDKSIGKIKVIAQDMERVILNFITNAFYAVTKKKKQLKKLEIFLKKKNKLKLASRAAINI